MSRKLLARFAAAAVATLVGVGALAGFGAADAEVNEEAGGTWSFRVDNDRGSDNDWGFGTRGATWS